MDLNKSIQEKLVGIGACKKAIDEGVCSHIKLAIKYLELHELYILNKDSVKTLENLELAASEYGAHQKERKKEEEKLPDVAGPLRELAKKMKETPQEALILAAKRRVKYYSMNMAHTKEKGIPFEEHKEKIKIFG